jgi:hypothetical protein
MDVMDVLDVGLGNLIVMGLVVLCLWWISRQPQGD